MVSTNLPLGERPRVFVATSRRSSTNSLIRSSARFRGSLLARASIRAVFSIGVAQVCHDRSGANNMDVFKLRLKIGVNEFEAEGSQEYVQAERQVFLESIDSLEDENDDPNLEELVKNPAAGGNGAGQTPPGTLPVSLTDMERLAHRDKHDKDLITLTALPQDADTQKQDALVLLLLAHRIIRNVERVKATNVLNGMKQSGAITGERLGTIADKIPNLVLAT